MGRRITVAQLRKMAVAIRATVDQGEFVPDDERSLIDQVIDDDGMLEDLETQHPLLFNALVRCDEDYAKQVEATSHMECSLDALDAFVAAVSRNPAAEEGPFGADDDDADGDAKDGDAKDGDPDADLGPERN